MFEPKVLTTESMELLDGGDSPLERTEVLAEARCSSGDVVVLAREQAAVVELGQRALSGTDSSVLMQLAVGFVAQILELEYCAVLELLPDKNVLLVRAGVGWSDGVVGHATIDSGSDYQCGYTLLSSAPVIVEDLLAETRFSRPALYLEHQVVSGISVVIHAPCQPFGVLAAHTAKLRRFNRDDIHFLQSIANVLAEAIGRKRAEETLQEARDNLERRVEQRTAELLEANSMLNQEIAQREQAEEALRRSEARFRAVFDRAVQGIALVSKDGCVAEVNPALQEMLGYKAEVLRGTALSALVDSDDAVAFMQLYGELMRGDLAHFEVQTGYARQIGRMLSRMRVSLVRDTGGEPQFTICTIEDITKDKRAEKEINERNHELSALNEITTAVSSSLELSEVSETLKMLLKEQMDITAGGIFLYDVSSDEFQLQTAWGLSQEILTKITSIPGAGFRREQALPQPDSILSLEFHEAGPFLIPDENLDQAQWQSYLRIPLVARGEIQGIVAVLGRDPSLLSDAHVAFFKSLGQQVGIAIQNARLFEQVRAGSERLRALSERLVEVQEIERRHIARELHDQIGQSLTALRLYLALCDSSSSSQAAERLQKAQQLAGELIAQVRNLSLELRPTMLDDLGLLPALAWHFKRYTALTRVHVTFEHSGIERRFQPEIETAIYRIVQEALTNVARHARVSEAVVRVSGTAETLVVEIKDLGRGFEPKSVLSEHTSSGLTGMRERAALLGGHLTIEAGSHTGARLTATLPLFIPGDRRRRIK